MADEAVRAVLERLLLGLRPPESREPRGGSLLVTLAAEGDGGDTGRPRCTITGAGGRRGAEPRRRGQRPAGSCPGGAGATGGPQHPRPVLRPDPAQSPAVFGFPDGISLLRQCERHRGLTHLRAGERLGAGGSAAAGPEPALCTDPSWLADWERFGFTVVPRGRPEGEEELVTPDAAYTVRHGTGVPGGDRHPQTLLLFLFLRHEDPFQVYDAAARWLLLAHLDQTLLSSRPALATGLRTLVHPVLEELCRQHEGQERLARSLPVVLDAVTAVVTGSTSARFRRACLRTMQVKDTPALAAAVRRSLAEVTHRRLLPCASCETPGDTRRGEG
ncbi:type 2 DNA topoisomerase 6 subunit B-like [Haliaeetus albicilla]|uniref:type 2 DNA topoisomerase 6 subunit B-like n=1 Tax=Haliaeetus albicilla TaxID=8969 RepID=UPI0037E9C03E